MIRTIAHSCPSGSRFPRITGIFEIYLAGGMVGVAFLAVMILGRGCASTRRWQARMSMSVVAVRDLRRDAAGELFPNPTSPA